MTPEAKWRALRKWSREWAKKANQDFGGRDPLFFWSGVLAQANDTLAEMSRLSRRKTKKKKR